MAKLRIQELIRSGVKGSVIAVVRPDGSCPGREFIEEVQVVQLEARIESFCAMGTLRTPEQFRRLVDDGSPPVWEMKADKGPGYRLYGVRLGAQFVITHGSIKRKSRQLRNEIEKAREIYKEWEGRR